jgi:hypothetical protein
LSISFILLTERRERGKNEPKNKREKKQAGRSLALDRRNGSETERRKNKPKNKKKDREKLYRL